MQVWKRFIAIVLGVMLIHGIIADGDRCAVKVIPERMLYVL